MKQEISLHSKAIKIFTIGIILLFTISTVGIPVELHICKTMNSISFNSCPMCNNDYTYGKIVLSRENTCCKDEVVASPLKTYYLISKDENPDSRIVLDLISFPTVSGYYQYNFVAFNLNSHEKSPPGISANPLFLTNRNLLI
jgi:hypothetical protein